MQKDLQGLKEDILKQLQERVKKIDFSKIDESSVRERIEPIFNSILRRHREISLSPQEEKEIRDEIISDLLGLGPIEKLLKDPEVGEIMVNGPKQVYVERKGKMELTEATFKNVDHLLYFIERILSPLGRRATEFEPYIDARLKDGSRVNIVRPPVSLIGPILTIRKFSRQILSIDDLIHLGTLNEFVASFLKACIISRLNILITGGGSSGKTTTLNVLASFIPKDERIITIEDTVELLLPAKHVIPLETRPPSIEGKGEITIRNLFKNALHMRPDRIIVGEVRFDEVLDMLQAMNIGHEGSMTTLHANSPLEALNRLELLALMGSQNISEEVARRQVITAIDLIIHMVRYPDGSRKISRISEVLKTKELLLQDIFTLREKPLGKIELEFTGKAPSFYPKLKERANFLCKEFEKNF